VTVASVTNVISGQRRHRPDYYIIVFMGILMLLGLMVMYAIGPERANLLNTVHNTDFYTENYFVIKQLISLGIAILAFATMATVPFATLKRFGWRFVQVGFALCAFLFLAGNILHIDQIAINTLGAYRWFNLGPLGTFQPAEVLKFALLIYMASFLGKRYNEGKINDRYATIYPMCIMAGAALFTVIVLQKDMGTGLAMASMIASMFVISTVKWKTLLQIGLVCIALGLLAVVTAPHRMERIVTFFSGDSAATSGAEADDNNYHIKNAMIALGTGGLFGRGIGKSIQATGYLPEAINDSIFAIMGEIFGFVGTTIIIGLFAGLLLRLLRIADHLPDMSMRLAVAGVFGWLVAHVVLNIASMIGAMPLTGITLPLLSFGGTSMVFMTGALGLAFQLSRYTAHGIVTEKEIHNANSSSRRRLGGPRYTSSRRTTGN
jgi:cell division protein FtsW